jgi:AraC-like DNA-binding protein
MKVNIPEIPARYYLYLGEVLEREKINFKSVLELANIDSELLRQPNSLLTLDQVERLIDAVSQISQRSDMAVELGKSLKLTSHAILGYGIQTSPTIEVAMRLVARYFRLIMPTFRMQYRQDDNQIDFIIQPLVSMSYKTLVFHLEVIAVAFHFVLRDLLEQRMPKYDLYFSIPEPIHIARYHELKEARCHFSWEVTPGIRLKLPAEIGQHALALADPYSLQMVENRCRDQIRHFMTNGKIVDWVSMMLRESSDGIATLSDLANLLNLSARTLDRYLKSEGVGFRQLSQKIRHERALEMLANPQLTATQIAYELGYSDLANFTRAFKAIAKVGPNEFRMKLNSESILDK